LTAKATAAQWHPDAIPWHLEPVLPTRVPARIYVDMVSQLYHAELAALDVLAELHAALPEARAFLATQIADEHRHAAVYRRYLERLGELAPIDPGLASIFAFAHATKLPPLAKVVALHVVMEHEALAQQQKRIDTLPCPLFAAVNRAILRDESRHAGFGVIFLTQTLPTVDRDVRGAIAEWVSELWRLWCEANAGRYTHVDAEVLRLEHAHLAARWQILETRLTRLGLTH
jgi:hypothetical protein